MGQFGHMLAAGVVEVLACGEYLDCGHTVPVGNFEQAGMKPLVQEQVRGQDAQHGQSIPPN
jgi:hypothetical protein